MTNNERYAAGGSQAFEYPIGDDETVVEAVLNAVVAVTDRRPFPVDEPRTTDDGCEPLPPLHDVVDPDALANLSSGSSPDADVRITFPYAGCTVSVADDDTVHVRDRTTVGSDE